MNTRFAPIAATLERVRARIERADQTPTLDALAQFAQLSPGHLQRAFRRRYGMSPAEYHRARRFGQLKAALRDGAAVTDAVYEAGFGSGSRVYENSDRLLGMTPASYRAGGAGASIRYTTTATPLGRLLVAATARGICAVTLGADDAELEARLAAEFPQAARERVDELLWHQHRDRVEEFFADSGTPVEFAGVMGSPVEEILEVAEQHQADLIVVGTGEPGLLERLMGGSVSQGVARRAHCDVLIVHVPPADAN